MNGGVTEETWLEQNWNTVWEEAESSSKNKAEVWIM